MVGKNIRPLAGRPLIHYTLDAAVQAANADDVVVVSTDSEEIARVSNEHGDYIHFMRPAELASDTSGSREVILHALDFFEDQGNRIDQVVMLQPTSPFRNASHVKKALETFDPNWDMLVSGYLSKSNPYFALFEENERGYIERSKKSRFTRRQDCPTVYELNGAIYIIKPESIKTTPLTEFPKTKVFLMSEEDSVDIDTEFDWNFAEYLMERKADTLK